MTRSAAARAPVALFHNFYQQPGGEDEVFRAEGLLLERHGHHVVRHAVSNDSVATMGRSALAASTLWNRAAYREIRALLRRERPSVAHFHNTFPLLSPAAYYAARDEGVPVVQTLHNYRLICPNAQLYREGRPCERCVGRAVAWPGVVHACYRGSRAASGVTAGMLALHRSLGTWREAVDTYVALTEFARRKFVEGGLPAERIVVKPNFLLTDPGVGEHGGAFALFVGRLSPEKGLGTLVDAWQRVGRLLPLKVVGGGPLALMADQPVANVEWIGRLPKDGVLALMRDAALLVFPSEWYEGLPVTVIEALATGLPVIASDIGAIGEIVGDGGRLFRPGDVDDLAATIAWAVQHPGALAAMGRRGRARFGTHFTADRNYDLLMDVYGAAGARLAG